ncbi:MAG: nitrate reductase gamma subunit, partial [Thermodesulfobacteriota bacterium]|nr:nitrate reductase gamma subunit [Thermodesulfobacteriota bacterium]
MNVWFSLFTTLILVAVLALISYVGSGTAGLSYLFGVVIPYVAMAIFIVGVIYRIFRWATVPVPFRIPTTCGQGKSLPWIKADNLESPYNTWGLIGRMALEVLFFRSLFRNTKAELREGPRITYGSAKWLWLAGILFHYSFLTIVVRHLRFFIDPVPSFVEVLSSVDGF